MGKIKITRKVTVTRKVQTRQQIQMIPQYVQTQPVITQVPHTVNSKIEMKPEIKNITTRTVRTLPAGIYSPEVEGIYDELLQRTDDATDDKNKLYDVFISHAHEDKAGFVDDLVDSLQNAGIRVWYDSLEMEWGKSLREQIDNGIKRSKYAMLIFSKSFFSKKWPKRELDGILAKETITGAMPLPIWHNISQEEVYEFSPTLAGIYAYSTEQYTVTDICEAFKLILDKEDL